MKDLLEKLKNLLKGIDVKIVLIICLLVAVIALVWLSWWKPEPVDTQQLLGELRAKLTKQFEDSIKARDATIRDLTNRVTVSDAKYRELQKRLAEVKNAPQKEPPKTNKELRDRFTALGFPPK